MPKCGVCGKTHSKLRSNLCKQCFEAKDRARDKPVEEMHILSEIPDNLPELPDGWNGINFLHFPQLFSVACINLATIK